MRVDIVAGRECCQRTYVVTSARAPVNAPCRRPSEIKQRRTASAHMRASPRALLRLATLLSLAAPSFGIATGTLRGGLRGGRYPRSPHAVQASPNALTPSHVESSVYDTTTMGVLLCSVHDSECIAKARACERVRWTPLRSSLRSMFKLCGVCLGAAIVMAINLVGQLREVRACGLWYFDGKYYDRRALKRR